jgi:hypothetical protein
MNPESKRSERLLLLLLRRLLWRQCKKNSEKSNIIWLLIDGYEKK